MTTRPRALAERVPAPPTPPPCRAAPDRWFDPHHRTYALAACLECPVRRWCAEEALRTTAPWGMWAGIWLEGRLGGSTALLRAIAAPPLEQVGEAVCADDHNLASAPDPVRPRLSRTASVRPGSVSAVVLARSSGHCEVGAVGCRFGADTQMSRLPNGLVQEATSAAEVFATCAVCASAFATADGLAEARRLGHRVDPTPMVSAVPFHWRGTRWVLFGRWGQLLEVAAADDSVEAS